MKASARHSVFNLIADPSETQNLAESQSETVDELRKELFRLRDEWGDPAHPTGKRFWRYFGQS